MSQPRIPASPGLRQAMEQEAAGREKKKGDDCYKEKFYQRALKHYTRGADLDPNDISFLIKRGKAYFHMHMYKECVVDCNEAVERARRLESNENLIEEALEWKGSALFNLAACAADYEQAIRSLKESLQLCPSNKETQGKLDGAESIMKNFQDLEAAQHHQDDGGELLRQGKWEEAAVQFTEAIKLNPADPKNFSDRAKCHIKLNVLAQGLEDADKCIELNRAFWKGYLRKGDIQFMMDNYEGAIATYLAGLKYGPQKTYIHDGLMRCAERIIEMAHDTGATVEKHVREKKYLRNELKKSKAEAKEFKEEATDERLRRIELDQMGA